MALTDESGMNTTMLVSPTGGAYPVYQQSGNNGFGDGNGWWIVLLIILLAAGNGFGYNNGGGAFGGQPVIVNDGGGSVQRGFDQAATIGAVTGVQNSIQNLATQICGGFGDVQTSLCNGFAGVNATVNSGFANAEIANNSRQIANMQQAFANQMATSQGFNQLGTQLATCCCENRQATNDLKYTIATENCADRAALSDGVRDLLANQTANTQRILDQLCQDKIDAKNEKIADLERQLSMATLRESQTAQNAFIQQGFSDEVDQLYNRLSNCPVPTTPVYGRTPIFTCPNNGCGCGCGM